jgi:hypothetical protein
MTLRPRDLAKAIRQAWEWRERAVRRYEDRLRSEHTHPIRTIAPNAKRRASEFARCYGSRKRVKRMKMRPCDTCGRVPTLERPNENSHVEGGGAGRKAGWQKVITQCEPCHRRFHGFGGSAYAWERVTGVDLRAIAARLALEIEP